MLAGLFLKHFIKPLVPKIWLIVDKPEISCIQLTGDENVQINSFDGKLQICMFVGDGGTGESNTMSVKKE